MSRKLVRIAAMLVFSCLQGCFAGTSCDQDSEAVAFAKSLSSDRLATLYQDAKHLLESNPYPHISPVPEEFSDLEPIDMRLWGSEKLGIKLEGCFDEFVFLNVDIATGQIVVDYGGGSFAGEDVLWSDDS